MRLAGCFLGVILVASFATTFALDDNETDTSVVPFKQGIRFDDFDLRFCKALYKSRPGNVAVSPVSVKLLLAMIYEAAAGESAREIQTALNLGGNLECRNKFRAIVNSLVTDAEGKCELKLSSRLFIDPKASYSSGYRRVLYTHFNAEIQQANFSFPLEAAEIINSWACNATNEKVQQLINKNDPNLSSMLVVLANTLFFRGAWETPFNPDSTAKEDFHKLDGTTVRVDLMRTKGEFFFTKDEECGFKLVRMPYQGGKYSLYLILPIEKNGLLQLVEELTPEGIREAIMKMQKADVTLALPKFSVKQKTDIKSILAEMGITKIFSQSEAELPKLSRGNNLHVSKLVHEAGLDVDETGSTAYAATQAQLTPKMQTSSEMFVVNRPFLLFIKDDTTETVVFAAKIDDPLSGGASEEDVPEARALTAPLQEKPASIYPPNFFPSTLNETMMLMGKLNSSGALEATQQQDREGRESSVIMRIPPKGSKNTSTRLITEN
ncbi:Hypothetical predicted protein [Cloeon dipterum]|uniref:Serpin domain-containing protein n=1 Tax=Cloeon dipterum TaxID=197152 RepID=A0A8S1CIF1_9INSE|nr:Hypothetical predicted protein [Cloeon dipterum]